MKILTLATSFPYPPDDGTKIQTFERIRVLSERHEMTLLSLSAQEIAPARIRAMERYCSVLCFVTTSQKASDTGYRKLYQMLRSVCLRMPYYIHDNISPEVKSWLAREAPRECFDVIEADGYANAYLSASPGTALRVAIFHSVSDTCARREIESTKSLLRASVIRYYAALTRLYECKVTQAADLCVVLTQDSVSDMQRLYPSARVRNCLSNGVDMDYFAFRSTRQPPQGVCFVGKMDYKPNVDAVLWFSLSVLPRIREKLPEFRFVIVGSQPLPDVTALSSEPGITVTGYVEDIRPYIRQCGLMVLPMRMGGGILNKLLQGLAMGVPVVATSLSLEGLSLRANRDLLVADSAAEMADCVIQLAHDADLRVRLATAGKLYVEQAHQWRSMVKRYEAELNVCLAERKP